MIAFEKVYDITILLGVESVSWPGDPEYSRRLHASIAGGGMSDVSLLTMTAHTGTHVDMPGHFIAGGRKLDDYEAGDFILPARVVDAGDEPVVSAETAAAAGIQPGEAVLFKTRNSTTGRIAAGSFFKDGVHVCPEAAKVCLDSGARLVGIDYYTIDAVGDLDFPAHRMLLEAGVVVLETVNLRDVPPGAYTLICLPLRMHGAEASPVRAVLLSGAAL